MIRSQLPGVDLQAESSKFISYAGGAGGTPGIQLAQGLKSSGKLRKIVVFQLGTNSNDGVTGSELDQIRSLFGDDHYVVFITARTNKASYDAGNARLRQFVNRYSSHYVLYDWAANDYSSSLIGSDGIHVTSAGAQVYFNGIRWALNTIILKR